MVREAKKKKRVGEREGNEECFSRRLVTGEIPRIPFLYGESLSFSLTRFCYSFFFIVCLNGCFFFFCNYPADDDEGELERY